MDPSAGGAAHPVDPLPATGGEGAMMISTTTTAAAAMEPAAEGGTAFSGTTYTVTTITTNTSSNTVVSNAAVAPPPPPHAEPPVVSAPLDPPGPPPSAAFSIPTPAEADEPLSFGTVTTSAWTRPPMTIPVAPLPPVDRRSAAVATPVPLPVPTPVVLPVDRRSAASSSLDARSGSSASTAVSSKSSAVMKSRAFERLMGNFDPNEGDYDGAASWESLRASGNVPPTSTASSRIPVKMEHSSYPQQLMVQGRNGFEGGRGNMWKTEQGAYVDLLKSVQPAVWSPPRARDFAVPPAAPEPPRLDMEPLVGGGAPSTPPPPPAQAPVPPTSSSGLQSRLDTPVVQSQQGQGATTSSSVPSTSGRDTPGSGFHVVVDAAAVDRLLQQRMQQRHQQFTSSAPGANIPAAANTTSPQTEGDPMQLRLRALEVRLTEFCNVYAPEKLHLVPGMAKKFVDREDELFDRLHQVYCKSKVYWSAGPAAGGGSNATRTAVATSPGSRRQSVDPPAAVRRSLAGDPIHSLSSHSEPSTKSLVSHSHPSSSASVVSHISGARGTSPSRRAREEAITSPEILRVVTSPPSAAPSPRTSIPASSRSDPRLAALQQQYASPAVAQVGWESAQPRAGDVEDDHRYDFLDAVGVEFEEASSHFTALVAAFSGNERLLEESTCGTTHTAGAVDEEDHHGPSEAEKIRRNPLYGTTLDYGDDDEEDDKYRRGGAQQQKGGPFDKRWFRAFERAQASTHVAFRVKDALQQAALYLPVTDRLDWVDPEHTRRQKEKARRARNQQNGTNHHEDDLQGQGDVIMMSPGNDEDARSAWMNVDVPPSSLLRWVPSSSSSVLNQRQEYNIARSRRHPSPTARGSGASGAEMDAAKALLSPRLRSAFTTSMLLHAVAVFEHVGWIHVMAPQPPPRSTSSTEPWRLEAALPKKKTVECCMTNIILQPAEILLADGSMKRWQTIRLQHLRSLVVLYGQSAELQQSAVASSSSSLPPSHQQVPSSYYGTGALVVMFVGRDLGELSEALISPDRGGGANAKNINIRRLVKSGAGSSSVPEYGHVVVHFRSEQEADRFVDVVLKESARFFGASNGAATAAGMFDYDDAVDSQLLMMSPEGETAGNGRVHAPEKGPRSRQEEFQRRFHASGGVAAAICVAGVLRPSDRMKLLLQRFPTRVPQGDVTAMDRSTRLSDATMDPVATYALRLWSLCHISLFSSWGFRVMLPVVIPPSSAVPPPDVGTSPHRTAVQGTAAITAPATGIHHRQATRATFQSPGSTASPQRTMSPGPSRGGVGSSVLSKGQRNNAQPDDVTTPMKCVLDATGFSSPSLNRGTPGGSARLGNFEPSALISKHHGLPGSLGHVLTQWRNGSLLDHPAYSAGAAASPSAW